MKRIASLILIATLAFAATIPVHAETGEEPLTREQAAAQIVDYLFMADKLPYFKINDYYCAHEWRSTHFTPDEQLLTEGYPLLSEIYSAVSGPYFADNDDISGGFGNHLSLAKAMGIISGYSDGTFRPAQPVKYSEAVKMAVCAAGLGGKAEELGGYPRGYVQSAIENGVVPELADSPVTAETLASLLKAFRGVERFRVLLTSPATPEECAERYAKAVMTRNGALQYALMSGGRLQHEKRESLESQGWITGVSSPWVSEYSGVQSETDPLVYEITFRYKTSAGPSGEEIVKLTLTEESGGYRIAAIE